MNILVIGNGFDLAHGLPTKYGDFFWGGGERIEKFMSFLFGEVKKIDNETKDN